MRTMAVCFAAALGSMVIFAALLCVVLILSAFSGHPENIIAVPLMFGLGALALGGMIESIHDARR